MPTRSERRRKQRQGQDKSFFTRGKVLIAGAAVLGLSAVSVPFILNGGSNEMPVSTAATETVQNANGLEQVRSGYKNPQDYIDSFVSDSPELKRLYDEGVIAGILYDNAPSEVASKLETLLEGKVESELLNNQVMIYGDESFAAVLAADPMTLGPGFYRLGMPHYINIPSGSLMDSKYIKTDDDFEGVLEHEGTHAEDLSKGISYGDFKITRDDFSAGMVTDEFMKNLMELRAHYGELKGIFDSETGILPANYSDSYIQHVMRQYAIRWSNLESMRLTDKEATAWELQMLEGRGITPVKLSDYRLRMDFDIGGNEHSLTITYPDPIIP